jgi:serine phosphatase RsbU (regulator of sigma subunit)
MNESADFFVSELDTRPGDVIFLSSDGYPDQFGSNSKSKMKYNRFREYLKAAARADFSQSKTILEDCFTQLAGGQRTN